MNWEIAFVFAVLLAAIVSFVREKISTDQTSLLVFAVLLLAGLMPFAERLPKPEDLITVFANPAPLTIAAMFVISAALEKSGLIEQLASVLQRLARLGYKKVLFIMIITVALASAFMNNTPIVVIFLPVVLSLARQVQTPASKMLIPLSYASIFGGTCTLVGTSTNILGSGILRDAGYPSLGMFELAWVGLPLVVVGSIYLTFFGSRILPNRETLTSILSDEMRREYITEAVLQRSSPLVGHTIGESNLLKSRNVRLVHIIRNGVELTGDHREILLEPGDRLILSARPSGVAHARSVEGLDLGGEEELGLDTISQHEGALVEGVIGPRSSIVGRTPTDLNFRQRFQMVLLAVHRRGENISGRIHNLSFEEGDTLLMMGSDKARDRLRSSEDIFLLDQPATPSKSMRQKAPIVLAILVGIVGSVSLGFAPIEAAAIIGVAILFVTGCVKPKEGYAAVEWSILILIYGMLALGLAMQKTGAENVLASAIVSVGELGFPEELRPFILLATVYLATTIFTELLSNNATVVLMAPIAIGIGQALEIDPRGLVIAVCIAASASFSTPIGYQTNTYVYGVGGYRFTDFLKIGIPMNAVYFITTVAIVPLIWPLGLVE